MTINSNPNRYKRINKDELRLMLDNNNVNSKSNENFILNIRDFLILKALEDNKDVIIDDTNLAPKHEERIKSLIKGKAQLVIKDFTDVPLDICILRDLQRFNSVGEKTIRRMYNQFLRKVEIYNESKELSKAIIVDVDGTLANKGNRSPFDWSKVNEDTCNESVKNIVNSYKGTIIIFSGRDGIYKEDTATWLQQNGIRYDHIYLREPGNQEKDSIIKRKLFEEHIRGKYYIEYVLDDRNQVVDMWRDMGLFCLQVAEGDF